MENFTKNNVHESTHHMALKSIIFVVFILVMDIAQAQDYIYNLNQYTPLNLNPAFSGFDSDASVSFLTRKTQIGPGLDYKNHVFTGEYPVINSQTGKRLGGIGVHFMEKDAGNTDLLRTYTIGLALAYNLHISQNQYITFGLQSSYYNKKTSLDKLTTGSQWLAQEFRFDPGASQDESLANNRINYLGINSGLFWRLEEKEGQTRYFAGLAAYNLNTPDDSFFEDQPGIPVSYLVHGGAVVYRSATLELTPQLMYQKDNINDILNLLVSTKLMFSNNNPYDIIQSGNVEVITKYDLKKDLSVGIMFNQPSISFGFAYNFPLATDPAEKYFRNGTELGIRLAKSIGKVKPKTVEIQSTPAIPKRNFNFDNQNNQQAEPQAEKSDADIIQENIKEFSQVRAVQFHLEKDFKFAFGRTELNDEAKLYLDDLFKVLQENPDYKLEVIGHTDNVGKHLVNFRLSEGRAQSVAEYLEQKGLDKERIRYHGKGDKDPVAPNDTEENRSKNRRVEFIIYINR